MLRATDSKLGVSYRLPFDAKGMTESMFAAAVEATLAEFIPTANVHSRKHHPTCFKFSKQKAAAAAEAGRKLTCRFRFPRKLEIVSRWNDKQQLRLRRHNKWVNPFHPVVSAAVLCNTDLRFLLSGTDCKGAAYYCSEYITKRTDTTNNTYTFAQAAVHRHEEALKKDPQRAERSTDLTNAKSVMQRCLNQFVAGAERSAPEVANILLGNSDHFAWDFFIPLFLRSFLDHLRDECKLPVDGEQHTVPGEPTATLVRKRLPSLGALSLTLACGAVQSVEVHDGVSSVHSDLLDYRCRPLDPATDKLCLYEFQSRWQRVSAGQCTVADAELLFARGYSGKFRCVRRRRVRNEDGDMLPWREAPTGSAVPVLWSPCRFPERKAEPDAWAMMFLCLFKPWREATDLLGRHSSWSAAYLAWHDSGLPDYAVRYLGNLSAMQEGIDQVRQKTADDPAASDDEQENEDENGVGEPATMEQLKARYPLRVPVAGSDDAPSAEPDDGAAVGDEDEDADRADANAASSVEAIDALFMVSGSDTEKTFITEGLIAIDSIRTPDASAVPDDIYADWPALRGSMEERRMVAERFGEPGIFPVLDVLDMKKDIKRARSVEQQRLMEPPQPLLPPSQRLSAASSATNTDDSVPVPLLVDANEFVTPVSIADRFTLNTEQRVAFYRVCYHLLDTIGRDEDGGVKSKPLAWLAASPETKLPVKAKRQWCRRRLSRLTAEGSC